MTVEIFHENLSNKASCKKVVKNVRAALPVRRTHSNTCHRLWVPARTECVVV